VIFIAEGPAEKFFILEEQAQNFAKRQAEKRGLAFSDPHPKLD